MGAGKVVLISLIVFVTLCAGYGLISHYVCGEDGLYKVQLIPVRGEISVFGQASSERIVSQIYDANDDPMTKAIIIEINSPGGTVVASEEIANAIEAIDKPVVAWMREVAASGGYWIASSADKIVADPATLTGSLGVSSSYLQFADLMDEYGVTYERVVSGKYKDTGSPYVDLSSDGRALLQGKVNKVREMFVAHISRTRNMSWAEVDALATGEIFLGVEAKENGLVDVLGSKRHAFAVAKELAGIESARLVESSVSVSSLLQRLLSTSAYWFGKGFSSNMASLKDIVSANDGLMLA